MYAYYFDNGPQPVCKRNSWLSTTTTTIVDQDVAGGCRTYGIDDSERNNKTKENVHSIEMSTVATRNQKSEQFIEKSTIESLDDATDVNKQVSQKLAKLTNGFKELEINDNEELSELLDILKMLQKLQAQSNCLNLLPSKICQLQNLTALNLSNSRLTKLPDSLSALKNLETLDLSGNQLEILPDSYGNLKKLKTLDISNNNVKAIPKCIRDGMVTLKVLDISQNLNIKMNIIPFTKNLEKFHAKKNGKCNKFPDWIVTPKFFKLSDVNLSGTNFDIYSFVGKEGFLNLKSLSMTCSNLSNTVLEMMIENMICLEKINVSNEDDIYSNSGNIFNEIPIKVLKNPPAIVELNFCATNLSSVSPQINQLINLKKLDVGLNCLMWLPEEICSLEKLEILLVDGNSLFMLPDNIGNLRSLKILKANNNNLVRLPESFKKLQNLQWIDFYNNKIETFPDQLWKMSDLQGLDIEQNYFSTKDLEIGDKLYSELYESYSIHLRKNCKTILNDRSKGSKDHDSLKSDKSVSDIWGYPDSSDEDVSERSFKNTNFDSDNDWEKKSDTDDEFDPEDPKIKYENEKLKDYMYQKPEGFCPEDLHLKRIKAEVASMQAYGSLPIFKIEEGQFDDADEL